ncbi:unnamed protein product [Closterium sp. NIES-54]
MGPPTLQREMRFFFLVTGRARGAYRSRPVMPVALCPVAPDAPARPVLSSPCTLPVMPVASPSCRARYARRPACRKRQRQHGPPAPAPASAASASAEHKCQCQRLHPAPAPTPKPTLAPAPAPAANAAPPLPLPSHSLCRGRGGDVGVASVTDQQPIPPFPLPLSTAVLVAVWGRWGGERSRGDESGKGGTPECGGRSSHTSATAALCYRGTSSCSLCRNPCLSCLSTDVEWQELPLSPAVPPPLPTHAPALQAACRHMHLLLLLLPWLRGSCNCIWE